MEGWVDIWDVDHSINIHNQLKDMKLHLPTPCWTKCYCILHPQESRISFMGYKQYLSHRRRVLHACNVLKEMPSARRPSKTGLSSVATDDSSSEVDANAYTGQIIGGYDNSLPRSVATDSTSTLPKHSPGPTASAASTIARKKKKEGFFSGLGGFLSKAKSTTRLDSKRKGSQTDIMSYSSILTPSASSTIEARKNTHSNYSSGSTSLFRTKSMGLIGKRRYKTQLSNSNTTDFLGQSQSRCESMDQLSHVAPLMKDQRCEVAGGSQVLFTLQLNYQSWIRPLHRSMVGGQKFVLAITANEYYIDHNYSSQQQQQQQQPGRTVAISTATLRELKQWLLAFKRVAKPNLENVRHRENSLRITVQEAKGLHSKYKFFCDLCLDRCFHARTTSKNANNDGTVMWYEEFDLKNLVDITYITINIYLEVPASKRKKRKKGSSEKFGTLTFPVKDLGRSSWRPLHLITNGDSNSVVNIISASNSEFATGSNDIGSNDLFHLNDSNHLHQHSYQHSLSTLSSVIAPSDSPNNNNNNSKPRDDGHTTTSSTTSVMGNGNNNFGGFSDNCAIRIEGSYESVDVLPVTAYASLKQLLLLDFVSLVSLLDVAVPVKVKTDLGLCLVSVHERNNSAANFLSSIIEAEVRDLEDLGVLFRTNSIATKSIEAYMKLVGDQYLWDVLHPFVEELIRSDCLLEPDPGRLHSDNNDQISSSHEQRQLNFNQRTLLDFVRKAWKCIVDKESHLPREMRLVFSEIRRALEAKRGLEFCQVLLGSCIFLRYFTAALFSPSLYGFCTMHQLQENNGRLQRNFTLIAKCLQQLANQSESFNGKEAYMSFMNEFLIEQTPEMKTYLCRISSISNNYNNNNAAATGSSSSSGSGGNYNNNNDYVRNTAIMQSRVHDYIDLGFEFAHFHLLIKEHFMRPEELSKVRDIARHQDIRNRLAVEMKRIDSLLQGNEKEMMLTTSSATGTTGQTVTSNQVAAAAADIDNFVTSLKNDLERSNNQQKNKFQNHHQSMVSRYGKQRFATTTAAIVPQQSGATGAATTTQQQNGGRSSLQSSRDPLVFDNSLASSARLQQQQQQQQQHNLSSSRATTLKNGNYSSARDLTVVSNSIVQNKSEISVKEEWDQLLALAEGNDFSKMKTNQPQHVIPLLPVTTLPSSSNNNSSSMTYMNNPIYGWNSPSTPIATSSTIATTTPGTITATDHRHYTRSNSVTPTKCDPPSSSSSSSMYHLPGENYHRGATIAAAPTTIQLQQSSNIVNSRVPRLGVSSYVSSRQTATSPSNPMPPTTIPGGSSGSSSTTSIITSNNKVNKSTENDNDSVYVQIISDLQRELELTQREITSIAAKLNQAEADKRFLQRVIHEQNGAAAVVYNSDSPPTAAAPPPSSTTISTAGGKTLQSQPLSLLPSPTSNNIQFPYSSIHTTTTTTTTTPPLQPPPPVPRGSPPPLEIGVPLKSNSMLKNSNSLDLVWSPRPPGPPRSYRQGKSVITTMPSGPTVSTAVSVPVSVSVPMPQPVPQPVPVAVGFMARTELQQHQQHQQQQSNNHHHHHHKPVSIHDNPDLFLSVTAASRPSAPL